MRALGRRFDRSVRSIEITAADAGRRLDRHLKKLLPELPLSALFKLLRTGAIRVDGAKAKPDVRLVAGMVLTLRLEHADLRRLAASAPPLADADHTARGERGPEPRIVHRDDDLLVVDKPAGLAVQPGSGVSWSLCSWLDELPLPTRSATFRPAPAHRLDRGTSGLVAIGLSLAAAQGLAAAFRDEQVHKVYVAVVHGLPQHERGQITAPLAVDPDADPRGPKVLVAAHGLAARSDYEVLRRGRSRALVRVVLHTGRTHQIRAHLAHLGHPIVGDRRYGSTVALPHNTFLLHAAELRLEHPLHARSLTFAAPAPAAFRAAVDDRR